MDAAQAVLTPTADLPIEAMLQAAVLPPKVTRVAPPPQAQQGPKSEPALISKPAVVEQPAPAPKPPPVEQSIVQPPIVQPPVVQPSVVQPPVAERLKPDAAIAQPTVVQPAPQQQSESVPAGTRPAAHFEQCLECGGVFDSRELGQVAYHSRFGHAPKNDAHWEGKYGRF